MSLKPNPEHVRFLKKVVNASPYPSLLGMQIRDIRRGYAVIEVHIEDRHLQLLGAVHGGVFASLIDTVAFWAVYFGIADPNAWLTSVDLKLNYLAPAGDGKLIATGEEKKIGKRLCYASAEVRDGEGQLLAHGASTLMVLPHIDLKVRGPIPPKFID